jgi:CubicO group peptidase (beta-lactamase class C family)
MKLLRRSPAMVVLCGLLLTGASARAAPADLSPALSGIVERHGLAGVAATVVSRDRVLGEGAAGRAVIDAADPARERALTADAPLRWASVSKLVMTLGVMRLVEQGKLDLDRDVSDYLGWQLRNPAHPERPVTLRLLLSHQSSLSDAGGYIFVLGERIRDRLGPDNWAKEPPGAIFSYANVNYGIAASVMEAATGERFDRLMTRLLFAPLKLDACFNWSGCSPAAPAKAVVLYRKGLDETQWRPDGPWIAQVDDLRGRTPDCLVRRAEGAGCDLSGYRPGDNGALFSPQGGVRMSVRDMGVIARMLLNDGKVDGVRVLKPSSVRAMFAPQWRMGQGATGDTYGGLMRCWGLSVQCQTGDAPGQDQPLYPKRTRWAGHLGDAFGLWSGLWVDRAAGRAYVYAVTGTADDPAKQPGKVSGYKAYEEAVLAELAAR